MQYFIKTVCAGFATFFYFIIVYKPSGTEKITFQLMYKNMK